MTVDELTRNDYNAFLSRGELALVCESLFARRDAGLRTLGAGGLHVDDEDEVRHDVELLGEMLAACERALGERPRLRLVK